MRQAGWLLMVALAASGQVRLPEYTSEVLPNGVRLYVMANADVPMVSLLGVVRGGAESDPQAKAGLASLIDKRR